MADFPQGKHSSRVSIIPARALDDRRLGAAPLKLLSLLGTYSDRDGWCWPSITTLAKRMGVNSRQAIQKHLAVLVDLSYLKVQHQVGGVNKYRILHDVDLPPEFDRMVETEPANVALAPPRQPGVAPRQREVDPPRQPDVGIEPPIEPLYVPNGTTPCGPSVDFDAQLYQAAEQFFGKRGRGMATKAKQAMGLANAVALFQAARTKVDPREYISAGIRRGPPAAQGAVTPKRKRRNLLDEGPADPCDLDSNPVPRSYQ